MTPAAEFLILMHADSTTSPTAEMWSAYFAALHDRGVIDGGSAIGQGQAFRKLGVPGDESRHLTGYIRVRAHNADDARALIEGNPVFECGGTVEIRALPRD